jgi:NTE family protein
MPRADLILEGGGVKGLGTVGAVNRLFEAGYEFPRVAGTSVGALVAALIATGMNGREFGHLLDRLDLARIPDRVTPPIPLVSEALSWVRGSGFHPGNYITEWLRRELEDLGRPQFGDFRRTDIGDDGNLPDSQRYSLVVMATDITHGRLLRLPWDYHLFNLDPDEQYVADAVRASMSIPFFFEACKFRDPKTQEDSLIVDGGVLSNFPVETFDRTDAERARWPTFGIRVLPNLPAEISRLVPPLLSPVLPPVRFLEALLATALVGRDQTHLSRPEVRRRTINIDTEGTGITDFGISKDEARKVVGRGWAAADEFLARWSDEEDGAG